MVLSNENETSKLQTDIESIKDELSTLRAMEGKKIDLSCAQWEEKLS